MQAAHLQCRLQANRSGAVALLILLVTIILGVLVYFFGVRISPIDSETARKQKESPEQYPWVEEWRIKGSRMRRPRNAVEQAPSEEQLDITEVIRLRAEVKQRAEPRGQLYLAIRPDGTVEGSWGADYETISPRMNYVIRANFRGNTDPSKIYREEEGEDLSKLFFITMGGFSQLETNFETNKVGHVKGNIYVTGWVGSDYTTSGRVHLTTDKKTQRIYEWSAKAAPGIQSLTR